MNYLFFELGHRQRNSKTKNRGRRGIAGLRRSSPTTASPATASILKASPLPPAHFDATNLTYGRGYRWWRRSWRGGHGDRNTGDAVRDETAYRALRVSQRGRSGVVGPRRSYCSGVGGARCELGRQWRRRSCSAATAAAATVLRESEGGGRRWNWGRWAVTGKRVLELASCGPTWTGGSGHRRRVSTTRRSLSEAGRSL